MFPVEDEMEPYIQKISVDKEWADGPIIMAVGLALQVQLQVVLINNQQAVHTINVFTSNADVFYVFYHLNHYQACCQCIHEFDNN
jgi:hypothetical protein